MEARKFVKSDFFWLFLLVLLGTLDTDKSLGFLAIGGGLVFVFALVIYKIVPKNLHLDVWNSLWAILFFALVGFGGWVAFTSSPQDKNVENISGIIFLAWFLFLASFTNFMESIGELLFSSLEFFCSKVNCFPKEPVEVTANWGYKLIIWIHKAKKWFLKGVSILAVVLVLVIILVTYLF